jgi:hypothetical protein
VKAATCRFENLEWFFKVEYCKAITTEFEQSSNSFKPVMNRKNGRMTIRFLFKNPTSLEVARAMIWVLAGYGNCEILRFDFTLP